MAKTFRYHAEHRHATWLELFFDLVFVACISVVTHDGHLDLGHALMFPLELAPIWWVWATHTLYANRFDSDGTGDRLASLTIMLLMTAMAAFLGKGMTGDLPRFLPF